METKHKVFLWVVVLATLLCILIPNLSNASPSDATCSEGADLMMVVAEGRTSLPPKKSFDLLLNLGYSPEVAESIVTTVYFTFMDKTPSEVRKAFYNYCTSEGV